MKSIKYLVMDVDGTLTNGKIYIGNSGELYKAFDIKDGCGIHDLLIPSGIVPVIITGRRSKILENRCKEIGIINLHQGVSNKVEKLNEVLFSTDSSYTEIAYIGDDINDLMCMQSIKREGGLVGCPADAVEKVLELADFVSSKNGGDGAVREFIEWILENHV